VEIAAGDMDRGALLAADFAPRQGFEETRAGGDRRLGRCDIVEIDTRIAIRRYLGRLRERCCRNTGWDRKEKCDGTTLERVHGVSFSFKRASAALSLSGGRRSAKPGRRLLEPTICGSEAEISLFSNGRKS
jgi:hypothetical protein